VLMIMYQLIRHKFWHGVFQLGVFLHAFWLGLVVFSRLSMFIGGHIYFGNDINIRNNCAVFKFLEILGSSLNNFTCAAIAFGYFMIRRSLARLEIVPVRPIYYFAAFMYFIALCIVIAVFSMMNFFFYNESYCLAHNLILGIYIAPLIETSEVLPFFITLSCHALGALFYSKNLFAVEEAKMGVDKEDFTKRYNVMFFWLNVSYLVTHFGFIFVEFYENDHTAEIFALLPRFFVLIGVCNLQAVFDCATYYKYLIRNLNFQKGKSKSSTLSGSGSVGGSAGSGGSADHESGSAL